MYAPAIIAASLAALLGAAATKGVRMPIRITCSGELIQADHAGSARRPWTNSFAFDLDRHVWCEANCTDPHPIIAEGPDFLDLIRERKDGFSTESHLNRDTGAYTFLSRGRVDGVEVETAIRAQCRRVEAPTI